MTRSDSQIVFGKIYDSNQQETLLTFSQKLISYRKKKCIHDYIQDLRFSRALGAHFVCDFFFIARALGIPQLECSQIVIPDFPQKVEKQ